MLRRMLLSTVTPVATIAVLGSAFAADLPRRAPPPLDPPPLLTWSGPYAGINGGGIFTNGSVNTTAFDLGAPGFTGLSVPAALAAGSVISPKRNGFIGGVQWGYNWQWGRYVFGTESDFQGTSIGGNGGAIGGLNGITPFNAFSSVNQQAITRNISYFGTTRVRAGFTPIDSLLIYATGGIAYGRVSVGSGVISSLNPTVGGVVPGMSLQNDSRLKAGLVAGGGLEWMFWPNWSLKAEALYYDLGRSNLPQSFQQVATGGIPTVITNTGAVTSVRNNGFIVRAGLNYHIHWFDVAGAPGSTGWFALAGAPPSVGAVPWSGLYAGLNAGGVSTSRNVTTTGVNFGSGPFTTIGDAGALTTTSITSPSNSGFAGGGQIGHNWQFGRWVFGEESDLQFTSIRGTSGTVSGAGVGGAFAGVGVTGQQVVSRKLDYLTTSRVRVGYLPIDSLLVYATGGVAIGRVSIASFINTNVTGIGAPTSPGASVFSDSRLKAGLTVGGGVEWMFLPNWSLKAEALYYDLGRSTLAQSFQANAQVGNAIVLANNGAVIRARNDGVIARAGVNYHFNLFGQPGPVIARY